MSQKDAILATWAHIGRLEAMNAELLKALKDVLEDTLAPVNTLAMMRAEAVIAKAEGTPPIAPNAPERQETTS